MNKPSEYKHGLDPICGRLCSYDNLTNLITRLALIEGSILERLEMDRVVELRELMEELEWEPCTIAMAVGSLVRQGMIKSTERGQSIFIEMVQAA